MVLIQSYRKKPNGHTSRWILDVCSNFKLQGSVLTVNSIHAAIHLDFCQNLLASETASRYKVIQQSARCPKAIFMSCNMKY
jgi:hypothetical protein